MDKKLPIKMPPIQTFLHHAYPLAILFNNKETEGWFFTNYTQLYTYYNRKNPFGDYKIDFYSPKGKYPEVPFVETYKITKDIIASMNKDILELVIKYIDNNYYIEVGIDEYYWPNKAAHHKWHYHHDNLLYGYNKQERVFYFLGYNQDKLFGEYLIGFDDFVKSFIKNDLSTMRLIKDRTSKFFDPNERKVYHETLEFDIGLFKQYLIDYLESKNSFLTHNSGEHSVYGQEVYHDFIQKITEKDRVFSDMRVYRILFEHKVIMLNRIQFLLKKKILTDAKKIYARYKKNTERFEIIKNLSVKYLLTNNPNILTSIAIKLQDSILIEKDILHDLLIEITKNNN